MRNTRRRSPDPVPFTLGTLEDVGIVGLPVMTGVAMMKAAKKQVARRCVRCRRQMAVMIAVSSGPRVRRAMAHGSRRYETYNICDECFWNAQPPYVEPRVDFSESVDVRVQAWLRGDDTGLSSRALVMHLSGQSSKLPEYDRRFHPVDPADFGRCYRMLTAIPELRERLHEAKTISPTWSALIDRWDDIEALYLEELPTRMAPKTYDLMDTILNACRRV